MPPFVGVHQIVDGGWQPVPRAETGRRLLPATVDLLQQTVRCGPARRVALHAAAEQIGELRRDAGEVRWPGEQLGQHVDRCVAGIGGAAGRRVQQGGTEGVHVGGRGHRRGVQGLLRGHVVRRPDHGLGELRAADRRPDQPEVDHFRVLPGHQHVRRLEIPVDQAHPVDGLQRLGDPGRQPQHRLDRQRPGPAGQPGQRRRRDVGDGQPRHLGGGVGVHQGRRVHTADLPGGCGLPGETLPEAGLLHHVGAHRLDRDQQPRTGLAQVHPAHPAAAEHTEQAVGADRPRVLRRQGVTHALEGAVRARHVRLHRFVTAVIVPARPALRDTVPLDAVARAIVQVIVPSGVVVRMILLRP